MSPAPEDPVGPGWDPEFLRRVIIVGEEVVLVGGRERDWALVEILEDIASVVLDLKITNIVFMFQL